MPKGIKQLGYRSTVPVTQASQAEHWRGFEFMGGPCQVIYKGAWGQIQVWAADEAEGRRVVNHACAAAGIDPADPGGEGFVAMVSGARFQTIRRYRTAERFGLPFVTVRQGPDGRPPIGE